ncbi:beta-ketoacyl-[acyl-carrier-protein] synthase family protein [Rhodovastum atsumiense]|uniref:Nodulation protein E n=1 Tax=Rhodovastum atsumiense TaxID=504468 RepID=A0A5M6IW44_9PROT|nr:beta-ketoacyl-[acyl-carrier-protein] synthase family protein [Rhodovastum atsumiense]
MRRVAVTGLGGIAATGHDAVALASALAAGLCGIRPIANIPTDRLSIRTAAEVTGFDPAVHFEPRRLAQLDRTAQFALVAARQAMQGDALAGLAPTRAGVVLGAAIGQGTYETAYHDFYAEGLNRFPPLTLPRCMPSGAASLVSMEFGLRGPCFAPASACASSTHAIGLTFHMIRGGLLDLALAGGSDASITPGCVKGWEALRVLSPDLCRPFSRDRTGLVLGEGAAVFLLEEYQHAHARGATIHAEILGFGMGADAADLTAPSAEGAAEAMQAALADAGLPAATIDYINAHGTGTRLNDRTETAAIRRVFGPHPPPVSSVKSMLGHCLCAGGALEFLATVAALRRGLLPPTINFREPDPECDLDCVPNVARAAAIEVAMSNSFAFGGLNAVLVARRAGP